MSPTDLPREELIRQAEEVVQKNPNATVNFKFTCKGCGERCTLDKPNTLYEKGECYKCGVETEIKAGGFMVTYSTDGKGAVDVLRKLMEPGKEK